MEYQGDLSDYLGVNIERRKDGKIEMIQPTLTLSILKNVGLWENGNKNQATSKTTSAYSTTILTSDEGGECEHTRILGALVEHPQGNLEEIQQRNPAEHPRGTCRPSGPQGLDVRHRELRSQPCTASENTGEAIRTLFG